MLRGASGSGALPGDTPGAARLKDVRHQPAEHPPGAPDTRTRHAPDRRRSRALVHSVNSTDAKGESMNPVAERIALAALR
ncbi:hypothetical protein ACFCYB_28915 [Streptomyces sp. NPDC056309]|uniref:hypothetical protein n=1 Tax=unclassified Streptomyces TaxID=2593676 RepID=UPI0035E07EB7